MTLALKRILIVIALMLAVLYTADYLLIEYRIHKKNNPFGTVQVESYSAVPEKNNRVEFFYNDPETEDCVHSLFPHFGDSPCWIAGKTKENRTDL